MTYYGIKKNVDANRVKQKSLANKTNPNMKYGFDDDANSGDFSHGGHSVISYFLGHMQNHLEFQQILGAWTLVPHPTVDDDGDDLISFF